MRKVVLSLLSLSSLSLLLLCGCSNAHLFEFGKHEPANLKSGTGTSSASTRPARGADAQDVVITQSIRKAILADQSMSVNAQNIDIRTVNRHVTISGAVDDPFERKRVLAKIQSIHGPANLTDSLEVLDTDAQNETAAKH